MTESKLAFVSLPYVLALCYWFWFFFYDITFLYIRGDLKYSLDKRLIDSTLFVMQIHCGKK